MSAAFDSQHLHFTGVALFILLVSFYFLMRKVVAVFAQLRRKWHPPSPYDPRLLRFDLNAAYFRSIFVVIGILLMLLAFYLGRYQHVGDRAIPAGGATFHKGTVEFLDMDNKDSSTPVRGHQAAACGIFLKFPPWLRYVGLGTYHKLITFRGFNENEYHYNPPPPEFFEGRADSIFQFLYKNRKWLKIPEAVYIESPYFNPGKREIIVTHSGYIVS